MDESHAFLTVVCSTGNNYDARTAFQQILSQLVLTWTMIQDPFALGSDTVFNKGRVGGETTDPHCFPDTKGLTLIVTGSTPGYEEVLLLL